MGFGLVLHAFLPGPVGDGEALFQAKAQVKLLRQRMSNQFPETLVRFVSRAKLITMGEQYRVPLRIEHTLVVKQARTDFCSKLLPHQKITIAVADIQGHCFASFF